MESREVLGIDGKGRLLVDYGDRVKPYKLVVGPGGALKAAPLMEPNNGNTVDQLGPQVRTSLAQRLASVDQGPGAA